MQQAREMVRLPRLHAAWILKIPGAARDSGISLKGLVHSTVPSYRTDFRFKLKHLS